MTDAERNESGQAESGFGQESELGNGSDAGQGAVAGSPALTSGQAAADSAVPLDWRQLLAQSRYLTARNAYLVSGEQDADVRGALAALADVQELLRERSFNKAIERISRLDPKPDLVNWDELNEELGVLKDTAAALDRRDPDLAQELLANLNMDSLWFPGEVYTHLGTTQIYNGDPGQAGVLFDQAIEADPQHYRALTNLGNVLLEDGKVDDAIALYERALKVDENFPNAHHNLGVAYRKKGHINKSVRSLRRAQRTQQRHEVTEARESIGKWAGPKTGKYIKWVVWGLIAVGVYYLLRATGFIS